MKIGIIGLPNVGKSTLFKALTKKEVDIQNYPFCTVEPNIGVVAVPDERLEILSKISKSKKTIPTAIEFFDIAGLVAGAHKGEGLGNKFLSHIRETDALIHVVRVFEDQKIIHVNNQVNPLKDIAIINLELIMSDLETAKKHLEKIEKEIKKGNEKIIVEKENLVNLIKWLEGGKLASEFQDINKIDIKSNLLSSKPTIYLLNKKASDKNYNINLYDKLNNENFINLDINLALEIQDVPEETASEYKKSLNISDKENLDEFIKLSYKILNLITFFTTGEDETRAWSIKNGSTASQAGRAIHTDFEEKFIRAQVIHYNDFLANGLVRTEGREYIVKDGDIIEFKINPAK